MDHLRDFILFRFSMGMIDNVIAKCKIILCCRLATVKLGVKELCGHKINCLANILYLNEHSLLTTVTNCICSVCRPCDSGGLSSSQPTFSEPF